MRRLPKIFLKKGKEKPLLRGHPWVFSGAVARTEGEISPGDVGEVYSKEGQFLGTGHLNPTSQIIVRLLTHKREPVDLSFLRERISRAVRLREAFLKGWTTAYRIINAEGDFLPGLIVDRYGEILVVQVLTAGMERLKGSLVDLLVEELKPRSVWERSDAPTRKEEGLPQVAGLLFGQEVSDRIEIRESGCCFHVDVRGGQKTGFYLDQRENRGLVRDLSHGCKLLDCFSYTGAFSVYAGLGGAIDVTLVDSSEEALRTAEEHLRLNSLKQVSHQLIKGDAFEVLRGLDAGYDMIVLDPPPFAKKKGHLAAASRGYKDLNLQALRLLRRGGLLFTFCCSHHVSWELFQKIILAAAVDGGREVQVLGRRGPPLDHPIHLSHPEGDYLKGLICRVL